MKNPIFLIVAVISLKVKNKLSTNVIHIIDNILFPYTICIVIMMGNKFYRNAEVYWSKVPATIDGVLGGFGYISDTDIEGSKGFLQKILNLDHPPADKLALDCGAGIGRVTKQLLMPHFRKVDLVEQDEKFVKATREILGENNPKLGAIYKISLQNFKPCKQYDVIWCQWVLGHLNDYDLLGFLERCALALTDNGIIVIKENIAPSGEVEYDDEDSSVTRPYDLMKNILDKINLKIVLTEVQEGFPEEIYPVHSFALTPMIL